MSPKRLALWFLIISVALSAALGIMALLAGSFGEFQVRVVLTTLTISAASILGLASGARWESGEGRVLPGAGITLAVLMAALTIFGIWAEPGEPFWKMDLSIAVLGIATSHTCLLSLAKLARRFLWVSIAAFAAAYLLALLIVVLIYVEPKDDLYFRSMGITGIVVAALTVMTPIFHFLSRKEVEPSLPSVETEAGTLATIKCPQCGASHPSSSRETQCDLCGCRFVLKIIAEGKKATSSDSRIFSTSDS